MIDQARLVANQTTLIIDVDSTHTDTYGWQEATNFNAQYGTMGYHPLVTFDGLTGHFLKAQLRPGNVYTSTEIRPFLTPLLGHYQQSLPCTNVLIRGNSGFATPELYEPYEANAAFYLLRLKMNRKLNQLAEACVTIGNSLVQLKPIITRSNIKLVPGHTRGRYTSNRHGHLGSCYFSTNIW